MENNAPRLELIIGENKQFDVKQFKEDNPVIKSILEETLRHATSGDVNTARSCLLELEEKCMYNDIILPFSLVRYVESIMYRKGFKQVYGLMCDAIKKKDYHEAVNYFHRAQACADSFGISLEVPEYLKVLPDELQRTDTNLKRENI